MTKPKFDSFSPLPGSDDAPIITAEQMSRFLYNHIGPEAGKIIAAALNGTTTPDFYGALQVTYVRRPFKAGEAVRYKADATKAMGWEGALLVDTSEADRPTGYGIAVINHKGVYGSISASDLERIL